MCDNFIMLYLRLRQLSLLIFLCAGLVPGVFAQSEINLRDQLRADYETLLNAKTEFEQVSNNHIASDQDQLDYAIWIQQLSEQFAQSCRTFSSYSNVSIPSDIPCAYYTEIYQSPAKIDIESEQTDFEKIALLDNQLNESLSEFDEKLLREQDRVKANKPHTNSVENPGDNEGAASEYDGVSSDNNDTTGELDNNAPETEHNKQQEEQSNKDQTETDIDSGTSGDGTQNSVPDDIPDASDDDVIARQLREAAEQEDDPELKKKLWQEYKRYKTGQPIDSDE